jgi:glycolate oxidase iron-sulfur subunit
MNYGKFKNAALCTHCGYCLAACPTYRVVNDETLSPRGRVSIIIALAQGNLAKTEASAALSTCLVCRACHSACPVGVRPAKLVLSARNSSPEPAPLLNRIFHSITDSHRLTAIAGRIIRHYQKSGLQGWLRRRQILKLLPSLHRMEALIPAHRPDAIPAYPPSRTGEKKTAALLCGCMARLFHPRVAPSTANLLDMLAIEVTVMDGFGCCGAPYRESGNRELFLKQARRTLEAFSLIPEVDLVLCDTTVCLVTIRSYARALSAEKKYATLAKTFTEKSQSLEKLLAEALPKRLPDDYKPERCAITFHDHCQTRHGLTTIEEPRLLVKKIAGSLSELPRADRCCGAGGDYMLRYPDLSHKIHLDKLAAIDESKAEVVAGCNSGCLLNIERGLRESGSSVTVRHLTELLWKPLSKLKNTEVSS